MVIEKEAGDWLYNESAPLIVWMNKTRIAFISKMRDYHNYKDQAVIGESVVVRENKGGMVNNEVGTVVNTNKDSITVDFGNNRKITFKPFLEDISDERPKGRISTRFGYAITAHTAQGGEWDRVLVDYNSYRLMKRNGPLEAQKWYYTACTRAKKELVIVKGLPSWLAGRK
jgi:ATP-dependent exoDNAse (exonuclease V) alpha subunit